MPTPRGGLMKKKYVDLSIRITPASKNQAGQDDGSASNCYLVRVDSPEGQGDSILDIPDLSCEIAGVIVGTLSTREAYVEGDEPETDSEANPRDFGEQLFEALFKDEARDLFNQTLAVSRHDGKGTRIRLLMDLEEAGMAEVAGLPWELMRKKDDDPLVVSVNTPLVRSLDVAKPTDPRPFEPPLRIMAVMSNPTDTEQLDLEKERERIAEEWGRLPSVEVDFVKPVRSELLDRLRDEDYRYHVFHFMGHGDFDEQSGGVLLLENEDRTRDAISGTEFATLLADVPLRLVFLNACKSGTTGPRTNMHPFTGVANALIRAGVPAVVAMQFPISDKAAIEFAKIFYAEIADQAPVEVAVAAARKDLLLTRPSVPGHSRQADADGPAEWATPVLFMRARDGMLFQSHASQEVPAAATAADAEQAPAESGAPSAEDPWGPGDGSRVFLAATTDRLRALKRRIGKELAAQGVRVLGADEGPPPPHEPAEHARAVEPLMRQAELCVHLLGDSPGEEMDDIPAGGKHARTYPWEQCRIGLQVARSQLVILPGINPDAIEDTEYRAFVDSLMTRPRNAERFQLVRTGKNQAVGEILAKLSALAAAQAEGDDAGGEAQSAFIDAHRSDSRTAVEVEDYLTKRNIDVVMQTSNTSPGEAMAEFDVNLKKYPLYFLVTGNADENWVVNRETAAMKSAAVSRARTLIGRYDATGVDSTGDAQVTESHFEIIAAMNDFDRDTVEFLTSRDSGSSD